VVRCESLVQTTMAASPPDPALASRLAPTIGLPGCLLQLSILLTQAAQLSLERIQKVNTSAYPHIRGPSFLLKKLRYGVTCRMLFLAGLLCFLLLQKASAQFRMDACG